LSGRNAPISFDIWWTLISGTVDADPEYFTKEGPFDEKGNTKLDPKTKDNYANITQEATDAADQTTTGTSVVSVTGSGSGMTVDITIASGAATALTINATGSGYAVGDELKIASADLTSSTADLLFTLTAVPGPVDETRVALRQSVGLSGD
jgi:hypothetical protein